MTLEKAYEFDAVIVGGTPAGIMTGITIAKAGRRAIILERTGYIGGLPANGLGATDIHTRGATGGLFLEFVGRIKQHYSDTYGADSQQVIDCSDGYRFEPHIAEKILNQMIAEQGDLLEVRTMRQFDHEPSNAIKHGAALRAIKISNRDTGAEEIYRASVFVDATYEGDLAAAAAPPTCSAVKAQTNTTSLALASFISAGTTPSTNITPPGKPTTPFSLTITACR